MLIEQIDARRGRRFNIALAVTSGLFLGFAFPPSPFYTLAYVGLVPLMVLMSRIERWGEMLRYTYLAMFVFHLVTVYWIGGFTHMRDEYLMLSGVGVLFFHPLFFWIPLSGAFFVRRRLGERAYLLTFPVLWVGFEYFHSLGDFSFPWLTLGNSQAYDLYRIQILELTSVYGLSMIVVVFNVLAYVLVKNLASRTWTVRSWPAFRLISILILIYVLPFVYGAVRLQEIDAFKGKTALRIGVVQPNIDPFEKWGEGASSAWDAYMKQLALLYTETQKLSVDSLDLVVWPETAVPFYVLMPQNIPYYNQLKHEVDLTGTPLFTGLPDGAYADSAHASPTAQYVPAIGQYFEGFNSATLFTPYVGNGPVYHKVKLVPFAERIPYAQYFTFLIKPLKWSVGISGWGKGTDQIVYDLKTRNGDSTKFSGMICYELIFPDYVREFVRKGAEFLVVISNDSWWGNTSGAYQLAAYTRLRAVENRRWIVRCANGGISAIIDPAGRMYDKTEMYTAVTFTGGIKTLDDRTFYVRYGDMVGSFCLVGFGLTVVAAAIGKRKRQ